MKPPRKRKEGGRQEGRYIVPVVMWDYERDEVTAAAKRMGVDRSSFMREAALARARGEKT